MQISRLSPAADVAAHSMWDGLRWAGLYGIVWCGIVLYGVASIETGGLVWYGVVCPYGMVLYGVASIETRQRQMIAWDPHDAAAARPPVSFPAAPFSLFKGSQVTGPALSGT